MSLTKKQSALKAEIEAIASRISMDHWDIDDYEPDERTALLEAMKNRLVRGQIVMKYALIDELLSTIICNYYFRHHSEKQTYSDLWRTKKFQLFNHYLMDETYLLNKLKIVQAIKKLPSDVRGRIERVNALRNAIAHSFFPENRRQYSSAKKVMYQGENAFSLEGVEKFEEDMSAILPWLLDRAFGKGTQHRSCNFCGGCRSP
jgi:hypothetical protein